MHYSYEMNLTERISNRPLLNEITRKRQQLDMLTGCVIKEQLLLQIKQKLIDGPLRKSEQGHKVQLAEWRMKYSNANSLLFDKLMHMAKENESHSVKIEMLMDKLLNQSKTELETKVMADEIHKMVNQIQVMKEKKASKRHANHSSPLKFKECGNNFRRFM